MSTFRVRTWHIALVAILTTAVVAAALAVSSAEASKRPVNAGVPLAAPYNEPIPAYDGFQGWGQVGSGTSTAYHLVAQTKVAWHWNGRSWVQRSRTTGTRVYIWPYAAGWSWTWTQNTGWLAMRTSDLTIGFRPIAIAT